MRKPWTGGLPGPRRLAHRLLSEWQRVRPFPRPRYTTGTPKVGGTGPLDLHFPPNAQTLAAAAMSEDSIAFTREVLERLTPSKEHEASRLYYEWGLAKFGRHWRHADILTVLRAASTLIQPAAYLEIGVRRGRSAAIVGATCPGCALYGFDLWLPDYADAPNPGPEFVRGELRAAGHRGSVELVSGDSRRTVPSFLRAHPGLYFDLINVDGDHSVLGAATDLANTLPRLKVGGIVVLDDICSFPRLGRVWHKIIRQDSRFMSWEFTESRYGVAAAVRISDGPLVAPRPRFLA